MIATPKSRRYKISFVFCIISFMFSLPGLAKEITKAKFNKDLFNIFGVGVYKINGADGVDYKFGKDLDSLSIYYDLTKGYSDQYLLYLSKELPSLDQAQYKKVLNRPGLLKQMVFEAAMKDEKWKAIYADAVACYLLGKGVHIKDYKYPGRPKFSFDEYFKVCSMFFYIYDYDSSGLKGKVCGGINPFFKEKIKVNPYLEAFTFTALIKILLTDPNFFKRFNSLIKILNQDVLLRRLKGNEAISFGKQRMYNAFFEDVNLRAQMRLAFQQRKDMLPFALYQ